MAKFDHACLALNESIHEWVQSKSTAKIIARHQVGEGARPLDSVAIRIGLDLIGKGEPLQYTASPRGDTIVHSLRKI